MWLIDSFLEKISVWISLSINDERDKGVRNLPPDFVRITFISNLSFIRFLSKSNDLYAETLPLIINNIFFNFFNLLNKYVNYNDKFIKLNNYEFLFFSTRIYNSNSKIKIKIINIIKIS